jgi:hypothetical protein
VHGVVALHISWIDDRGMCVVWLDAGWVEDIGMCVV